MALTPTQASNAKLIIEELKKRGVINTFAHSAILSVVSKETGFNPANTERSYKNTENSRIKMIFSKTVNLADTTLTKLKADDVAFFNHVYNGIAGNGPSDGYKYRGRGYNQLTGKGNYATMGKAIGLDLVANPELVNSPAVAAKVAAVFFITGYNAMKSSGKAAIYNTTSINDFKNLNDSLGLFYHVNAGIGQSTKVIKADVTGGLAKAKSVVNELYAFVQNNSGTVASTMLGMLFFWA